MGMTTETLEARRKHLGASETPIILGCSPYAGATPDKVYWSKVGPPAESKAEHLQMGNDFEPALVQFAQRTLGETFVTEPSECFQVLLDGIGKGILSATPDGILLKHCNGSARRWGLEGKAVMAGNPGVDAWGEPDTDKVPDGVLIQCQQQMAVWNLDLVWVPVLWCIGFRPEFRMYRVERDADLFGQYIAPPAVEWWNKHIVPRRPPGDEPPPLEVIKRLERRQGVLVPADAATTALIETWAACRQSRLDAEKDSDATLREILAQLGDAEGFNLPDGRTFKYLEQNGQRRCDLDALEQQYPDAYKAVVTQTKHRTPRITGKVKVTA